MACCYCTCVAALIGSYFLLRWTISLITQVFQHFQRANLKSYGKWAAVTGCTSGIGEEYAFELARQGLNVILVGRNAVELERVSKEITTKHKVNTQIVKIDLGKATSEDIKRAATEITNVPDFGILVNNAGVSYDFPNYFHEVPVETHRNIIQVNISAVVELTHAVLPTLLARKKSAIINVSSLTGIVPVPLLATYSASKAFVEFFSQTLATEYGKKGVFVSSSCPGMVCSKMSKIRRASFFIPTAKDFAASAVAAIGVVGGRCVPFVPHRIQTSILPMLPNSLVQWVLMSQHVALMKKAKAKSGAK
jgi:17beta-estradiol 17-dehydrogenase / very-long-chain 3-oxoacyl-CoA reductase